MGVGYHEEPVRFRGKTMTRYFDRITLQSTAQWEEMEIPGAALYWRLKNLDSTNALSVSYDEHDPGKRSSSQDKVFDTVPKQPSYGNIVEGEDVPESCWLLPAGANVVVYIEFICDDGKFNDE